TANPVAKTVMGVRWKSSSPSSVSSRHPSPRWRADPMNTRAISKAAAAYLAETPVSVRRNLLDSIEIYRNEDAIMRDKAIEAIAEHRAAFWTISSYNDAIASALPFALNASVDISTAIENAYERRPDT